MQIEARTPAFSSTRTDANAAIGATRAATKPLGPGADDAPVGTSFASAHTLAVCPEARYVATCSRPRSIFC